MCGRAVFSEGDAARPITASQPPVRVCKTSKHYRSRLARPLFFKAVLMSAKAPTTSLAAANPSRSGTVAQSD